ncbi:1-acyl-sn-glycerol-3-phosphate acyltransferase [Sphingobacterium hungaricum]|uniref:Glycerol acyltransferase n=1 Tax=Sphingobacterium hungaricum TaxID=2082723 RepID=A0A928UVU5_9SPHI|nr:1-acyl-sn-glycerol-3-phosphate acyltransferase [Sphingobacterium hungaricum]MBE8713888.1 glycerol acyltransferase [Sphingobacterium hungaricum]
MHLFFYHIYQWVERHKGLAIVLSILFLVTCGFLASKIRFEEDITQLIPKNEQADLTTKAIQQINFADKITVLISKQAEGTLDDAVALAQSFVDSLASDTAYIKAIEGEVSASTISDSYNFIYQHIPIFLDSADYSAIDLEITPEAIRNQVASNFRSLSTASSFVSSEFIQIDPLGIGFFGLEKLKQLNLGNEYILYNGFVATKDSANLLLFINPTYQGAETEHNEQFVADLYQIQDSLNHQFSSKAQISSFGSALVAVANAKQIKHDILTTVAISMTVLMILLIVFYRRLIVPILVFIPTIFASLFSIAVLYLYKPVISAISISIGAVLIGITIDYALHVLTHYKKNEDVKTLYKELTKPILMSGATTAVAFLCLLFVHSEALIDLGIFASLCVFSSAVFTLLLIPHLYKPKENLGYNTLLDKVAKFPFERSKILIAICLILIAISVFTSSKVTFNNDLANLNFIPEPLKQVENRLDKITNSQAKSIYVIASGNSFEEALLNNGKANVILNRAKSDGLILDFAGIQQLLKTEQQQKEDFQTWRNYWNEERQIEVKQNLQRETAKYGFSPDAHQSFYDLMQTDFNPASLAEMQAIPTLGIDNMVSEKDGFYTISTLVKLDESNRTAFVEAFAGEKDILTIDRKQLSETYLGKLRDDFNSLVSYSFIAVLAILWLFFRRIELVLLSAIPIGLTGLVTAGLMGLFGLQFNIFSAIVCTLVFGHGVDFSIFMTTALQKQYSTGKDELQTYRTSILLAVLTTVLAIGALIFAKHPALISISTVSLIGVFSAVLITFVFYPILFRFFISNRAKKGRSPFTIFILVFSILLFLYYGLGCLLVSFYGRIVLKLIPMNSVKRDLRFRRAMASFMKTVLYFHPLTTNKTLNPYGETFEKPAIVIGNHSSFLDTLSMGMLVPKAIYLVNDWVWKSPIFGKAVQALGFYPVSQGLEDGLGDLEEKIKQGYNLVIFPEGTRSYDNLVKRFHKGAFFLSEKLQVDILPIYLHGNGDVLPKGDFMIFKGNLTPVIGERIPAGSTTFGDTYTEKTKQIAKYFKTQFTYWRSQLEDEDYFIRKLNLAYLYKDDEIVASVKQHLKVNKRTYFKLNSFLKEDETISHLSNDYGELDFLLSLQSGYRKIYSFIEPIDRRQVAQSIYYTHLRKVFFPDSIYEQGVLLISKSLSEQDLLQINFKNYSKIITINPSNDLNFLSENGFILARKEDGIEIYELNAG